MLAEVSRDERYVRLEDERAARRVALQSSLQPLKAQPFAARAVSASLVPGARWTKHSDARNPPTGANLTERNLKKRFKSNRTGPAPSTRNSARNGRPIGSILGGAAYEARVYPSRGCAPPPGVGRLGRSSSDASRVFVTGNGRMQ